jgi:hypothetical protein
MGCTGRLHISDGLHPSLWALTTIEGQGKGLIDKETWNKIEEDLGEITEFKLIETADSLHKYEMIFKANGVEKKWYFSNPLLIVYSCAYIAEAIGRPKKYTPAF